MLTINKSLFFEEEENSFLNIQKILSNGSKISYSGSKEDFDENEFKNLEKEENNSINPIRKLISNVNNNVGQQKNILTQVGVGIRG